MAVYLFLVLSLCVSYKVVDGKSGIAQEGQPGFPRVLYEHDLKKTLTKSTKDDDFDCVDIYKQPAFQHPLLKNHKIELYPSFFTDPMKNRSSNVGKGCPLGKVPTQRRSKNSSESKIASFHKFSEGYPGHHFATLDTTQNTVFHGGGALINVYNPSVQINQFSMALIWVVNGPPSELNSIQVGWAVHPILYGDNLTRITTYWTADGYQKTGCYNAVCPGFIQVHRSLRPGINLHPTSVIGGKQYTYYLGVKQDKKTGHWWLIGPHDINIGYWPKDIFTHLANGASLVSYGGTTLASPNGISPPMGSGVIASTKFGRSCFFVDVKIVNSNYEETDIDADYMKIYSDAGANCYTLWYKGYQRTYESHYFTFGGPGGQCGA